LEAAAAIPFMRIRADAATAKGDLAGLGLFDHLRSRHPIDDPDYLVFITAERTRRPVVA
jgi:hypothetical protein